MDLRKYSIGIGDRFAHQGQAQLTALCKAREAGVSITPVWNKSFREHSIIGSVPVDTRKEADKATAAVGWQDGYFVDADHISMKTVDYFLEASDFFTLDVADFIGRAPESETRDSFMARQRPYLGTLSVPGCDEAFTVTEQLLERFSESYLRAVQEAGTIYRHLAEAKKSQPFITEVSFDEAKQPQSPLELFLILAALAIEGVPVRTVAPKFTGQFYKGVDYVGDIEQFEREFRANLAVLRFAVEEFDLPASLKLSVHSGSDKFSLYPVIRQALKDYDAGLHLKTAGTTWLEEVIGLAMAGGEGLVVAKEIYHQSVTRFEELCKPYATVLHIEEDRLPDPDEVNQWDEQTFADSLRHNPSCPRFNSNFRQLLHIGFRIAAEMGDRYLNLLEKHSDLIAEQVTTNLFERHLRRVFIDC